MQTQRTLDEFRNEPFTDFSVEENKQAMEEALAKVTRRIGSRISRNYQRRKD